MDDLFEVQQATNSLYRNLFGLDTSRRSFKGQAAKDVRRIVLEDVNPSKRNLTARQLLESPLSVMKGIDASTAEGLKEALGIARVADLAAVGTKTRWTEVTRYIELLAELEN